jgi:hypothetical protein
LPVASRGPLSALIVEVPEAEPAVARYRDRFDASAPLGVPTHITEMPLECPGHAPGSADVLFGSSFAAASSEVTLEDISAVKIDLISVAFAVMSDLSDTIELEDETRSSKGKSQNLNAISSLRPSEWR